MKKFSFYSIAIAGLVFTGCKHKSDKQDFLAANIDSSVLPSTDFFQYANGGWIKKNPIPADESSWGVGNLVQEELYIRLKTINEKAIAEGAAKGTVSQKIADFWQSGMDTVAIDKAGLNPLKDLFTAINVIKNADDVLKLSSSFTNKGIDGLFDEYIGPDDKNSEVIAYRLWQGGISMPDRDYYFNTDSKSVAVKTAYQKYLYQTFVELGNDSLSATKKGEAVFALETKLAKANRKLEDIRDPYKQYNKFSTGALSKLTPNINWQDYFTIRGMKKIDSVIVSQPEYFAALSNELKATPVDVWKDYLRFRVVRSLAPYLDSKTYQYYFDYRKTLYGTSKPRPRWKRVLNEEETAMGDALGQLFVKEYFSEKTKERYNNMVEAMRVAYKERIEKLPWMSEITKKKALSKLSKMDKKVGYPDMWKDFSAMEIDKVPFVINMMHAKEWWNNYSVNKLGKPVDHKEWSMTPQTYNAYYSWSNNDITLAAAMLTIPGMKDEDLDEGFLYGFTAAGIIGHEMTHGFDDQGRQYDGEGNLKSWWLPEDSVKFTDRAKYIIRQFNEFVPVDTMHVNGSATQGENIADLGGLRIGLDAFKKTDVYKNNQLVAGMTPLQRYFLGYAYSWMFSQRKERLASQLMTDVHAPVKERVNGPLVNLPEFYEAFNVKPGDKMYRADSLRVNIW